MNADRMLDDAIDFAAEAWPSFDATLPPNIQLRDKLTFFAQRILPTLKARFPDMAAATDQVMLLVLARGIEQSGRVPRHRIERDLGILLPP